MGQYYTAEIVLSNLNDVANLADAIVHGNEHVSREQRARYSDRIMDVTGHEFNVAQTTDDVTIFPSDKTAGTLARIFEKADIAHKMTDPMSRMDLPSGSQGEIGILIEVKASQPDLLEKTRNALVIAEAWKTAVLLKDSYSSDFTTPVRAALFANTFQEQLLSRDHG
jgi:hypothetical protein